MEVCEIKKAITLFLVMLTLISVSAPALAVVGVEEYENLPPPMVVTCEYIAPPTVVVEIPAYSTEPKQPAPVVTPKPAEPPKPRQVPADVRGDYSKGTVYGPSLSSKERKELKTKVGEIVSVCVTDGMTDREKIVALVNNVYGHCEYAPDWSKNRANTAWGALVYGEAQCSDYARGMVVLFDAEGIEQPVHPRRQGLPYQPQSSVEHGKVGWEMVSTRCADARFQL